MAVLACVLVLGACSEQGPLERAVFGDLEGQLQGSWSVEPVRGFERNPWVADGLLEFSVAPDGESLLTVSNACGGAGDREIRWDADGFTVIESDLNGSQTPDCGPDDIVFVIDEDPSLVQVVATEPGEQYRLIHVDWELELTKPDA